LPTTQQEAELVSGRLLGRPLNYAAYAYTVSPNESKPTTLITNNTSGKAAEVITDENFRAVSRDHYGKPGVGAYLASSLFRPNYIRWVDRDLYVEYFEQYMIAYKLKRTDKTALLASKASEVLARYEQGELDLRLSKQGRELLAHTCELIDADAAQKTG
jgi:hypothetical protein